MRRFLIALSIAALAASGGAAPRGARAASELVAPTQDSAFVGRLASGDSARGRLAGAAGAAAYHTYVVEVPAGAGRLVLTLDADVDLDLFAKHGSEIASYDERARGGDADLRDLATTNPTVMAAERPAAGAWYVDVVNLLGAGVAGSYRLTVAVEGSAPGTTGRLPAIAVPDGCTMLALLPDAAGYGPPPAIRAGTRLIHFGITASVPSVSHELVPDPSGDGIDPDTGQRWGAQDMPGASGAGFTVVRVGHVDAQIVQLTVHLYTWEPTTNAAMHSLAWGLVSHAGCAGDFWVHPDALRTLPEMDQGGVRILRMPYRVGERTFDAVRIQTTTTSGLTAYVYDLATGLMIFNNSRTQGSPVLTPPVGGRPGVGEGSTQYVTTWFVEVADVDVPWRDQPTPSWVAGVDTLDLRGTMTSTTMGGFVTPLAMDQRVTIDARGPDWLHAQVATTLQSLPGMPPSQSLSTASSGPASIGGLWIAPQAMAWLQAGQVIERNAVVGTTTRVSATTGERVTITETGPLHQLDYVYDRATGLLVGVTEAQQVGTTRMVYDLGLIAPPW